MPTDCVGDQESSDNGAGGKADSATSCLSTAIPKDFDLMERRNIVTNGLCIDSCLFIAKIRGVFLVAVIIQNVWRTWLGILIPT